MKLYYAPGACSLAPHIALREAERTFDLERVDLKTHRTARGTDYYAINRKGYVPALQLDGPDSEILTENVAILSYIADLAPHAHLAPPAGTFARYHLLEWLAFVSTEVHKQFGPLFYATTPVATQEAQRAKLGQRFLYLQDVLGDRAFLMGESFTVADAYLYTMLTWCERYHLDLQLWPNLDDYYLRVRNRPAVEAAMAAEGLIEHRWRAA
jgi:glutathione S-transferase